MTLQTRSDVVSQQSDHGFLYEFSIRFESTMYRSQVICDFSGTINGGMSISAGSWRFELKVTRHLIVQSRFANSVQYTLHA
jgi:hypothetical protein